MSEAYIKELEEQNEQLQKKLALYEDTVIIRVTATRDKHWDYYYAEFKIGEVCRVAKNKYNFHYPQGRSNVVLRPFKTFFSLTDCEEWLSKKFKASIKDA